MPSPFPGMDPYLESAEWTSVHHALSMAIARQLAPKVRPKYIVRTEERFVADVMDGISATRSDFYPDVSVAEATVTYETKRGAMTVEGPIQVATIMPTSVPHVTIHILNVANRKLVTAVEVISSTNKRGTGYQQYLSKRSRILLSSAHLLEIDLPRQGTRVPMQEPLPEAPYFVFLSRAEKRPFLDVWPIHLPERLPTIPVPLLLGDDDVTLDLQQALDTIYDELGYDLSVNYTQPPEIPLTGETAVWATEQLQAAGFSARQE
jgi:hypothetical protein